MSYPYFNTRLRSMEGEVLSKRQVLDLCSLRSLSDFMSALERYGYRFSPSEEQPALHRLEAGIRNQYHGRVSRTQKMQGNPETAGGPLLRIVLGRWDIYNVKTLIRGRLRGRSAAEVMTLTVPAGFFDEGIQRESLRQPDLSAMIAFWFTLHRPDVSPLRGRVRKVLGELAVRSGEMDLFETEMALHRAFVQDILDGMDPTREEDRLLRSGFRREVDRLNLLTALRIGGAGEAREEDPGAYFIGGGQRISLRLYQDLSRSPDLLTAASLLPSPWNGILSAAAHPPPGVPPLLYAELLWECRLIRELSMRTVQDPLGAALGWMFLQKALREALVLRWLAAGIATGMPGLEMEEWVRGAYR